jgi:ATP synthase F0 subunit b
LKRRIVHALALLTTLLVPALVLASGGEHGGGAEPHINWWHWDMHAPPLGWFLLDFVIFAYVLVRFSKRPIAEAFKSRHEAIKKTIEDNSLAASRAKAKYSTARERLASIEVEARELIKRIESEGTFERDRIIEAARGYAQRIVKDTQTILALETQAARERLRADVARQVLERAEQTLVKTLTSADRERMLDEAISEIENGETAASPRRRVTKDRTSADESGEAA